MNSKLSVLVDEKHESYYWAGFILADGTIYQNKRLTVTLSEKDEKHTKAIAKFLSTSVRKYTYNGYGRCVVSCQDVCLIPQFCKKFDIYPRKTENPPKRIPKDINLLKSLFIGYCDGDGSIRRQTGRQKAFLSIKVHKAWMVWLNEVNKKLLLSDSGPYIASSGYCEMNIGKHGILCELKRHAIKYKLPILKRKWDRVSLEL